MSRSGTPHLGLLNERYRLLEVIGKGGMGVVYRAEHEGLHKTVAIKVLRDELITDSQALARFHQEAVAAAAIGHRGIVKVTDYGVTRDGQAFLVMEYLQGRDLADVLTEQGALPIPRAVALARKILAPLGAAHACGIIHRDLKTNNVFVLDEGPDEQVKLLDFGVSKVLQEEKDPSTGLTSRGAILGTPRYTAPEQAQGDVVDRRADIYAMGVVLHELLSGEVPFTGRSALEVLFAHVQKAPPPLRQVRPDLDISAELEAIVLRALAKDPDERFPTAQAFDEALAQATSVHTTLRLPAARRSAQSFPWPWALVAVAGLGLAGVLAWLAAGSGPTVAAPDAARLVAPPVVRDVRDVRPPDASPTHRDGMAKRGPADAGVLRRADRGVDRGPPGPKVRRPVKRRPARRRRVDAGLKTVVPGLERNPY